MAAKTTALSLENSWLDRLPSNAKLEAFRGATIYAQPEELALSEEPLDRDVSGNTVEFGALYDGLESGRWIIVSGQRTDVSDASGAISSTGVVGNELVMIAAVTQGAGKDACLPLTVDAIPFARVYSVAGPNETGDSLVVGQPNPGFLEFLATFPLPDDPSGNQQICNPIQLASGLYANAYVPTAAERDGNFGAFAGLLTDPATRLPFPGGIISTSRLDTSDSDNVFPIFAWRIAGVASGNDTLHTNVVLANSLAYQYQQRHRHHSWQRRPRDTWPDARRSTRRWPRRRSTAGVPAPPGAAHLSAGRHAQRSEQHSGRASERSAMARGRQPVRPRSVGSGVRDRD